MDAIAVVPVAGKELGCVARRPLALGERLVAEAPLLVLTAGTSDESLDALAAALSPTDHDRLFELAANPDRFGPTKSALAIMATNGIPYRHRRQRHGGVFPLISRINHACDANACYKFNPDLGQLTVHATRPIAVDEEITFNCARSFERAFSKVAALAIA